MFLDVIAEVVNEPLVLAPAHRETECAANTWSLGADAEDRRVLSASEVDAAFEQATEAIRRRVAEMGFAGTATFYVWHDVQAGQLRCSTASVPADQLPFGGAYTTSETLDPIVEGFLRNESPGLVSWEGLEDLEDQQTAPDHEPKPAPLLVWVRSVGA